MSEKVLVQSNAITQARYEYSKIEKRIIYLVIKEIRKKYIIGGLQGNLFEKELVMQLTYKDLKEVSGNAQLVYKSLRSLRERSFELKIDDGGWKIFGFINDAEQVNSRGPFEISINKKMLVHIVDLAKNYTEYSLTVAMSLRSEYSQRLYEYCSQFRSSGGFRMSLKDMREKMKLTEKYARYASFKKKVIEVAYKELKELYKTGQCDLYFEFSEEKNGRTVENLRFKIISNDNPESKLSLDDLAYFVRNNLNSIFDVDKYPKNKEFINDVMMKLILEPEKLNHCHGKITWVKSNLPKEEWQRYMRFVIKDEYLNDGE